MHRTCAAIAVALASAVQLAACSSGKHVSSIDTDKTFASLPPDQSRQWCEDRAHYMSSRVSDDDWQKIRCSYAASAAGGTGATDMGRARAACQEVYNVCMSGPKEQKPTSPCDDFATKAKDCAATVGDADDCTAAQADDLESAASKGDDVCKELGRRGAREQSGKTEKACTRVDAACPNLLVEPALEQTPP